MSAIDQLLARRQTILNDLAEMTKISVGGKPDAMSADSGTSVAHRQWRMSLYDELKHINELIKQENEIQAAVDGNDGAFEIITEIVT